jgi:transposase
MKQRQWTCRRQPVEQMEALRRVVSCPGRGVSQAQVARTYQLFLGSVQRWIERSKHIWMS